MHVEGGVGIQAALQSRPIAGQSSDRWRAACYDTSGQPSARDTRQGPRPRRNADIPDRQEVSRSQAVQGLGAHRAIILHIMVSACGKRSSATKDGPPWSTAASHAFTKEKPGCWTRRRVFEQVRRGSNIQLLSFSLVT
jgi:hypothetical protein